MDLATTTHFYKYVLAWILLSISFASFGQQPQFFFDHYGLENGFTSREASAIVTTPNGMVWISSNNGLVRFDSKRFKFFKQIPGDSTSLTNNYCQALATDKRGYIWVQSDDHLDVFNPATEKFFHVRIKEQNLSRPVYPKKFAYDSIADIMWVATVQGLYYSKKGALNLQSVSNFTTEKLLANAYITTMVLDDNGMLWVTTGIHIIKLDTRNGTTEKYKLPNKVDGIVNPPEAVFFQTAYLDANQTLWLGMLSNGLVSFNTQSHSFHQYCFRDYTKEENSIIDIAQTQVSGQEQKLWLSTVGYGLAIFDMVTKRFTSYNTSVRSDPFGVMGTTYGLYADGENGMWIGAASGLHRYDYHKQLFEKIDLSGIADQVKLLPVSHMAVQRNEDNVDKLLWFYIPYKGGYLYDLVKHTIKPLPPKVKRYIEMPAAFLGFFIDRNNVLWISTINDGIIGYDIGQDAIIFEATRPFIGSKKGVWSFFEDRIGRLWIGSFNGLFVLDSDRKNIVAVNKVNQSLGANGFAKMIVDITEDDLGNIWFIADGTDKQIACAGKFNPVKNEVQYLFNEKMQASTNPNSLELVSIVHDGRGNIFTSITSEGIVQLNAKQSNSIPPVFSSTHGLISNRINQLLTDNQGYLWCNTNFGISCFKLTQKKYINYNYTDFALDHTQMPSMYISPQSGVIYVGQSNAIRYFNPAISMANKKSAQMVFTEMKVLNQPFIPNKKLLTQGEVIELDHDQNFVSFEFALLSFTNSADNTYSWLLEGWDKGWVISNNNIASYIQLEPGSYTFYAKAANSQGEWTAKPLKLILKIAYPFYQTWWFITLCLLASIASIYGYTQRRIRRLQEKHQLRNSIAADLHDEIGSTLTSINILSNVGQQTMELQPQHAREMLEQISAQSKTIQQSMSDIVWSIRPDNEKVEDLVTRMREYAVHTMEPLGIDTTIGAEDELAAKLLSMQYRKELLLIYKEAINNIAKHSGATRVVVTLVNSNKNIQLTITDDGKWKGASSGTGSHSMKARAAGMGGTLEILHAATGTTVVAVIPVT